jgi:hypothetical protein
VSDPYVALSLPICRPKQITIGATFVLRNFADERHSIVLDVQRNVWDFPAAVERPASVIVGSSSLHHDFNWGVSDSQYE